jgi:hypothetical protein
MPASKHETTPGLESERVDATQPLNQDRTDEARGRDLEAFPPGYWYSSSFIGSFCVGLTDFWTCQMGTLTNW